MYKLVKLTNQTYVNYCVHVYCAGVPFSSAARAPALADVTASAPADAVEFCHKNADCKTTRCAPAGSFAFCLDGVCSCEVTEDSPVQIELTSSTPVVEPKVDRYGCPPSDCFEISCVEGCPERVHGRCQCVRIGPF